MTVRETYSGRLASNADRLRRAVPLEARDRRWLTLALVPSVVAVCVYLATNPYPAYGAGLYTQIAEEIIAGGYAPPTRIPGYTADGVPFAYPPLQFYVLAVLIDMGGDPVTIARFLPSVAVVAVQIPVYLLARDYTGSRPAGAATAAAVALNPQILEWHISAGGVVRAFAYLYALTAIYAGYHVFTSGDRRAVLGGLAAFGLTLLTHPTYSLFVVTTYLLMWAVFDRSLAGLVRGAIVGLGGTVVASPWLAWMASVHGVETFAAAGSTHGGIGGGMSFLYGAISVYTAIPLVAAAYLLVVRRERFLPLWFVAAEVLFKQPRFSYTVGSFALVAVGLDVAGRIRALDRAGPRNVDWRAAGTAALILAATVGGGAYLAYEMTLVTDPTTPEFLDDEAVEAMEWAATETPEDATFVVLGDAAEWFPVQAERTILVGPWGVEWEGADKYEPQLGAYKNVSACQTASCVERTAATVGANPDYVYVPKGRYTVRGAGMVQFGSLERSFERSPRWELAFENEGVAIYRARAPE
ncbi:glycosyltransferase family 39 protein [Halopelagius fulvigenes]|uniref:Glycosyltransferase family 39 protein n=1 Tax=Halopelagius fulvigenes TaxID=1198324 RepID=A0ABD5TZB1_9EURY